MLNKTLLLTILFDLPFLLFAQQKHFQADIIHFPARPNISGGDTSKLYSIITKTKKGNLYYVSATLTSNGEQQSTDIDLPISIDEPPSAEKTIKHNFHWVANIKMQPGEIIADHVFRSPCIIHTLLHHSVVLIPDINLISSNYVAPYYLDLNYAPNGLTLHYGIADYKTEGHVYYTKNTKPFALPKQLKFAFYLFYLDTTDPAVVVKKTDEFIWQHFAAKYTKDIRPQTISFERYADTGYNMALNHFWVNAGKGKGGITLSTFYDDSQRTYGGRNHRNDLWFQSWFNNMRTAYGLYSWGKRLHKDEWVEKARDVTRLLVSSPINKGWFSTIYNTEANTWLPGGVYLENEYYTPDDAWSAYWLLRFNSELEELPGAKKFLLNITKTLLNAQNADGSFPAYIRADNLAADTTLNHSASSAMGTWFLEEMLLRNQTPKEWKEGCINAVKKSNAFLIRNILFNQRFEDFESFFSCSGKPMHYYDSSTAMFNQNTLSMQWCAEALLKGAELFHDKIMLSNAEYCVNILSLYQQVWSPPFISFYAFGGFGSQNTDGEWSDARQAQFADTYLQFYQATHGKEYLERAVASCRASFALMVLPENKNINPNNYKGVQANGESFSGSMAENYGHYGFDERSFQSGFHWGTGSALTTAAIFQITLGDIYIDPKYHIAEGINGVVVKSANWGKKIVIRTERLPQLQTKNVDSKVSNNNKRSIWLDGKLLK